MPGEDSNSACKRWKASVVPVGRDPFRPGLVSPSPEPGVQGEVAGLRSPFALMDKFSKIAQTLAPDDLPSRLAARV